MSLTSVRVPDSVVYRPVDGATVVMSLASGEYASLTNVGARIWTFAAKHEPIDRICEVLCAEYDITPADCREQVTAFLADLASSGFLEVV